MTTYQRYTKAERMSIWSLRIIYESSSSVDITPILAKTAEHVMDIVWRTHHKYLKEQIPDLCFARDLAKHTDIRVICDGVWAKHDYVSNDVSTTVYCTRLK